MVVGEIGVSRIVTGPESDHWQCLSVTDSLTDGRLVNLIDVTLARVDDNSKCVKAVTVVVVDDKNCVNNSLEQTGTVKLVIKLSFVQI